jgi:2-iminobutanoate/2-iminopropanoate deaminase
VAAAFRWAQLVGLPLSSADLPTAPYSGVMNNRRKLFTTAVAGLAAAGAARAQSGPTKKVIGKGALFSSAVSYGNLLFLAGIGAHFKGDIKAHTDHVLKEIEKKLQEAGSSMDKVLKVSVFLNDLKDYKDMNDVFKGRFGENPPVRTTVAAAGGIPGDSLVEMDVIAYI